MTFNSLSREFHISLKKQLYTMDVALGMDLCVNIQLIGNETYYSIAAADAPLAVILSNGDQVTINYHPGEGPILSAIDVTLR